MYTIRAVRISFGYTEEEVANYCKITVEVYTSYENDFGTTPKSIAVMIKRLFGVPLDKIYADPENNCFKLNRDKALKIAI